MCAFIYGEYFSINIKASLIEIVSYVLYFSILYLTITVSLINTWAVSNLTFSSG